MLNRIQKIKNKFFNEALNTLGKDLKGQIALVKKNLENTKEDPEYHKDYIEVAEPYLKVLEANKVLPKGLSKVEESFLLDIMWSLALKDFTSKDSTLNYDQDSLESIFSTNLSHDLDLSIKDVAINGFTEEQVRMLDLMKTTIDNWNKIQGNSVGSNYTKLFKTYLEILDKKR